MSLDQFVRDYEVTTLLTNPQKRLGLVGLLNLLQDIAWAHAEQQGHGFDAMIEKQLIWVLSRQSLVMERWPRWREQLGIRTWLRPPKGATVNRDFEILIGDQKIGECTTSWLTLNLQNRKPTRMEISREPHLYRTDYHVPLETPKIERRESLPTIANFKVRNSDLDLNGHVNNTRYAQWILDSIPFHWHQQYCIQQYIVNFLAETQSGDEVEIQTNANENTIETSHLAQFQGFREHDQKQVFTAQLHVTEAAIN